MKVFFLICIVVAGVFGGLTVSRKILFVQALPAMVALVVLDRLGLRKDRRSNRAAVLRAGCQRKSIRRARNCSRSDGSSG